MTVLVKALSSLFGLLPLRQGWEDPGKHTLPASPGCWLHPPHLFLLELGWGGGGGGDRDGSQPGGRHMLPKVHCGSCPWTCDAQTTMSHHHTSIIVTLLSLSPTPNPSFSNFTPIHESKTKRHRVPLQKATIKDAEKDHKNESVHFLGPWEPHPHPQAQFQFGERTAPSTQGVTRPLPCRERRALGPSGRKKTRVVLFFRTVPIVSSQLPSFQSITEIYPKGKHPHELMDVLCCFIPGYKLIFTRN